MTKNYINKLMIKHLQLSANDKTLNLPANYKTLTFTS